MSFRQTSSRRDFVPDGTADAGKRFVTGLGTGASNFSSYLEDASDKAIVRNPYGRWIIMLIISAFLVVATAVALYFMDLDRKRVEACRAQGQACAGTGSLESWPRIVVISALVLASLALVLSIIFLFGRSRRK